MAWSFSARDARRLVDRHQELLSGLSDVAQSETRLGEELRDSVQGVLAAGAMEELLKMPVEELNRDRRGFRVKTLRDAGITNLGQLRMSSPARLAAIKGISDESARKMLDAVGSMASQLEDGVRVSLSADRRTPETDAVVVATCALLEGRPLSARGDRLLSENREPVTRLTGDVQPATRALRRFFLRRDRRARAERAYADLERLGRDGYVPDAVRLLDEFRGLAAVTAERAWADFSQRPVTYLNAIESVCPGALGRDQSAQELPQELAQAITETPLDLGMLRCTLRPYQEWGARYALHQRRALLGDEMGLGKTVQAIAVMASLAAQGATRCLVICPASVLVNWTQEVERHSTLGAREVHGASRSERLRAWERDGGVAVTTFETATRLDFDTSLPLDLLVVDEAHYIKNPAAKRSRAVRALARRAGRLLLMTGTPLENNVGEMVELICLAQPEVASEVRSLRLIAQAPRFRKLVAPVYLRRRREDVLGELPELMESEEWCPLGEREWEAYGVAVRSNNFAAARRLSWDVGDLSLSSKARRLSELVEQAAEEGRKVVVFSFFLQTLADVRELMGERCVASITGAVGPKDRQEAIDAFSRAPAGSVLVAQVLAGGTGLNIQAASLVIFCEPQLKPSLEAQAIGRAYRMGQVRSVLVYRLLSPGTIDARIRALLERKQGDFDAFADESVAAQESSSLDEQAILAEAAAELDARETTVAMAEDVPAASGERPAVELDARETTMAMATDVPAASVERPAVEVDDARQGAGWPTRGYSVTQRVRQVTQPRGGYLRPRDFEKTQLAGGGLEELPDENVSAGLIGLSVDYLTRFMTGTPVRDAFSISRFGAGRLGKPYARTWDGLARQVVSLDDGSIRAAIRLCGFDCVYRAGAQNYRPVESIEPDAACIDHVRTMVERSLRFLEQYGPKVLDGLTFEGGYANLVSTGDGDFLTADTLWDFKVSKKPPKTEHTLQLLMYWRMALHSIRPEYKSVRYLGIYNPRRNVVYRYAVADIPQEVIEKVERDVIGY